MVESLAQDSELIRRPVRNALGAAAMGLVVAFGAAGTLIADSVAGKIFYGLVALAGVVLIVRIMYSGVVVTSSGLTIRGALLTRRVAWSQVRDIWSAAEDPAHRAVSIVLDNDRIRCSALAAMRRESPHSAGLRAVYQRLYRHLEAARSDGRSPAVRPGH